MNNKRFLAILAFAVSVLLVSCRNDTKPVKMDETKQRSMIPAEVQKVFDAHGGLNRWTKMQALYYRMPKETGDERQWVDLKDRRERIETDLWKMGFDGKDLWLDADTSFKSNPVFYKNLMFYFYAMPFVLADEGIIYEKVDPLVFDSMSYPGIKISYQDSIGVSPEDEYFLHYDPESFEMIWLGYTVTYFSKKKSDKIRWIRYDDWTMIRGLKLPMNLTWYNVSDNLPVDIRNSQKFEDISISEKAYPDSQFMPTGKARVVN